MTLYLVSTPIGNLEDVTLRALRVLSKVDIVATEDTRVAGRLLAARNLRKVLKSYYEHNEEHSARELLVHLKAGKDVALVTNAGTPCISDPGYRVVRLAIEHGIPVVPIPGPTAFVSAVQVSGLPVHRILFLGFPPRKDKHRRDLLVKYAAVDATLVFYEAPHRIVKLVRDALGVFGPRPAALCREMTKKFEEVRRGTLAELLQSIESDPPRGEIVLVVGGAGDRKSWAESLGGKEEANRKVGRSRRVNSCGRSDTCDEKEISDETGEENVE